MNSKDTRYMRDCLRREKKCAEKFNCQEVADERRVEDQFVLMAGVLVVAAVEAQLTF